MAEPGRLPLLAQHDDALQRCVYCPKLCRATCPVSETEGRESVTPWGKMSAAWFMDRGNVPIDPGYASLAWACTGCHACTERCDHANRPAKVLDDARADLFARGAAPAAARDVAARFEALEARADAAAEAITQARQRAGAGAGAGGASAMVLVGCSYLRDAPEVATDALAATEVLLGGPSGRKVPVRPVAGCCGLPLLHAGDREGFERAARRLAAKVRNASELVVVDPGCARALLVEYPAIGVDIRTPKLFVDLAAEAVGRMQKVDGDREPPRWHDPCQLGRGLGRYDEPRAVLERVAGAPPREHARSREHADCSGGGGLLPLTRPETSAAIAAERLGEHRRLGGGKLVTGCASSLRRFRASGEDAEDLVTWVARGLGVAAGTPPPER
jgi:Fe-S oxidoreductase